MDLITIGLGCTFIIYYEGSVLQLLWKILKRHFKPFFSIYNFKVAHPTHQHPPMLNFVFEPPSDEEIEEKAEVFGEEADVFKEKVRKTSLVPCCWYCNCYI